MLRRPAHQTRPFVKPAITSLEKLPLDAPIAHSMGRFVQYNGNSIVFCKHSPTYITDRNIHEFLFLDGMGLLRGTLFVH